MQNISFTSRCHALVKQIPRGKVATYKAIADAIGTKAYRAVGTAMKKSPRMPDVPCHRVVCSDGRIGGFNKGVKEKIRLLRKEGVEVENGRILEFESRFYDCRRQS